MKIKFGLVLILMLALSISTSLLHTQSDLTYPIVDTGQTIAYDTQNTITGPAHGEAFFGQDAQYQGNAPDYVDNGDGTVSDTVTGLMWTQSPDLNGDGVINSDDKRTQDQALVGAKNFALAGYADWRLPSIKELYSLIVFSGQDPSGWNGSDTSELVPFIDPVFAFSYGDAGAGERIIDAQFASSTFYASTVMDGAEAMFGVNFADGRIKGYPINNQFYVLYVRGNPDYGINDLVNNHDGTITDNASGLTWMQADSGAAMSWENALAYCESLVFAGQDDWRLPNVKALQSIIDYSRSPDTDNAAAIDPVFTVTAISNEVGQSDFPSFWSSTTHANMQNGSNAAYVAFGRALGYMRGQWLDVHGAGAQRSDPKWGNPADYPTGHGPQGDAIRIDNFARCVRGDADPITSSSELAPPVSVATQPSQQPSGPTTSGGPPPTGPGQGAPPQEAINACTGLNEGAACSFNTPQGTITGTCMVPQGQLACVPAGGPGGQPPGSGQP